MSYAIAYMPSNTASVPARRYFVADTAAELPTVAPAVDGDFGYAKDTDKVYSYNGSAWAAALTSPIAESDVTGLVTDLAAKVVVGGQIGGTAASPTVLGIRETLGPTLLTIGTITDGEFLKRSGSTLISGTPAAGDFDSVITGTSTIAANKTRTIGGGIRIAANGSLQINADGTLALV